MECRVQEVSYQMKNKQYNMIGNNNDNDNDYNDNKYLGPSFWEKDCRDVKLGEGGGGGEMGVGALQDVPSLDFPFVQF